MKAGDSCSVYVPANLSSNPLGIADKSAIVGYASKNEQAVAIWFEGAIYGQSGLERYVDRVMLAYGRMVEGYPTVAKAIVERHEVVRVGLYLPGAGVLPSKPELIRAWLRVEHLVPETAEVKP